MDAKLEHLFLCYGKLTKKQMLHHKLVDNYVIPKCPVCDKVLKWKNGKYQSYCSKECQYHFFNSEEYKAHFKELSIKKFKVDNPMKNEMIQISQQISTYTKYLSKNYTFSSEYKSEIEKIRILALESDGYYKIGYRYIGYLGKGNHKYYCPKCEKMFETSLYNKRKNKSEICTNCNPISYYKQKK